MARYRPPVLQRLAEIESVSKKVNMVLYVHRSEMAIRDGEKGGRKTLSTVFTNLTGSVKVQARSRGGRC